MRERWAASLFEAAASLALRANTPLPAALAMPVSDVAAFFATKAWKDHAAAEEARDKLAVANVNGLGAVIRSIGNLGKTLAAALGR